MPTDKLRVGIIGIGAFSVFSHVHQLRETGKAEIVAVSRRDPERLAMAQKAFNIPEIYTDWREMLEKANLDAVVVSTPDHVHAQQTLTALDRGLHVLVEKPMALTSRDAWTMVDAAKKSGHVLMVGYLIRLQGIWQRVKRALEEGMVGKVRQINLAYCGYGRWKWETDTMPEDIQEFFREVAEGIRLPFEFFADHGHNWYLDPAKAGGGLFANRGTHWVDLMLWLGGAPPAQVVAFTENAGLPVDCFVNVQARLANGVLLSITSGDAVPQGLLSDDRHVMIVGDQGVLTDDREGSIWIHRDGDRKKLGSEIPNTTVAAGFVSTVMEGGQNPAPAHEGAYAVALTEAVYRSAEEGRIIQIEYPADHKIA